MTTTLEILTSDGARLLVFSVDETNALYALLRGWTAPEEVVQMEVRDEREVLLTVFPDGSTTAPRWSASAREVLASVAASSFLRTVETLKGQIEWAQLLPADPLISLSADLLGNEKLSLLRACVPESRALPGDWAPAALVRSVAHELTEQRFGAMLATHEENVDQVVDSLIERLPRAEESIARIETIDWMLAERVRLLLVARGWLDALDATPGK